MKIETERKFLVTGDGWKRSTTHSIRLRDGLLLRTAKTKLRVRREDARATLTYKGPKSGIVRREFEYEIPCEDADLLLSECGERVIEKTRHHVEHLGATWLVDVYHGAMEGVVIAEIELPSADHEVVLPNWLGREVSRDPGYRKINLMKNARRRQRRKASKSKSSV